MSAELLNSFSEYYTHSQFYVHNVYSTKEEALRDSFSGSACTPRRIKQGFMRTPSHVCFFTPAYRGTAKVSFLLGEYDQTQSFDRVIGVPFEVKTGEIDFWVPEGSPSNKTQLPKGHYWLVMGQSFLASPPQQEKGDIVVHFYFEKSESRRVASAIIKQDPWLNPVLPLDEEVEGYKPPGIWATLGKLLNRRQPKRRRSDYAARNWS